MGQVDDEKRQERQHRRQVVREWKSSAKVLLDDAADSGKKLLQREARREALARIEDAARTQKDFENVSTIWDEMENMESDRVGKYEKASLDTLLDYELGDRERIIPPPFGGHVWWKRLLIGNFLDLIHDCPHEVHELTSSRPVYELTKKLDENRKEILYYWAIRQWSPQQIAAMRGQTDRNIRKVYNKMIDDIRYELFYYLYWRYKKHLPITTSQKKFVIDGIKKHGTATEKEADWKLNEGDIIDTSEDSV